MAAAAPPDRGGLTGGLIGWRGEFSPFSRKSHRANGDRCSDPPWVKAIGCGPMIRLHGPGRTLRVVAQLTIVALAALLLPLTEVLTAASDPALAAAPAPVVPHAQVPAPRGYWLTTASGEVLNYGTAVAKGSVPSAPTKPVVGIATSPLDNGYWLA